MESWLKIDPSEGNLDIANFYSQGSELGPTKNPDMIPEKSGQIRNTIFLEYLKHKYACSVVL